MTTSQRSLETKPSARSEAASHKPPVTVVGGGMITRTQLLPTLYHMQREGHLGEIHICALDSGPLREIQECPQLRRAFPGQSFTAHPDPARFSPDQKFPQLYQEVLAAAPRGSVAVIAVPDQFHYDALKAALANDLHVCVVKPMVLKYAQAVELERMAYERGLVIGVEYHKRFDTRNLMARQAYREGRLGEFRLAQAQMIEPWYYRYSNFQNWCICENSDMFTYVGCHYVDLVAFITGLRPVAVSVYGIVDEYPNGNKGFLWTDGRVIWENGACLSVVDAIGYPNAAAGSNAQGLTMWCQGPDDAALLVHSDQYRGVKTSYTTAGSDPGDTIYCEPNPDYFQYVYQGGEGLVPTGYGHRSAEHIVRACIRAGAIADLAERQRYLKLLDADGIMATPANSSYNELVIEASRLSILNGGREVVIQYGDAPGVAFRQY
ncbi:MAG: putative 4,5-dihydroxyphthalate dehydrogenase [candidate division BRC1 bacterium ADurb.BinA292]|nr:MAG: putative 4,5-dihydroxyphthalate dehydrogenase [candidate division BRC1 bacterium ADurb.BinA292]